MGDQKWQHRDILLSGLKDFVCKSDGERPIVAMKHVRKLREGCGSDRSAVRGEWSRREPGQRGGRASDLGDVDDADARVRGPGFPRCQAGVDASGADLRGRILSNSFSNVLSGR